MATANVPALAISLIALAISAYGIGERRYALLQAERLRFATIMDGLNSLQVEHSQAAPNITAGDLADAVNSRRELLAVQGLLMLRKLGKRVTSPELRTLAHALSRAGYPVEAEDTWGKAISAAPGEGRIQSLSAHRGHAYFLFDQGRLEEARTAMRRAIETVGAADDASLVHQIKSLKYWAIAETQEDPGSSRAAELSDEAAQAVGKLKSAKTQQILRDFLGSPI